MKLRRRCLYCRRLRFRWFVFGIELEDANGVAKVVWRCRRPCPYGWEREFREWIATGPPGPPPGIGGIK